MIFFGFLFSKHPPQNINSVFGYRTGRSTKNKECWNYAHKTCGKYWIAAGAVSLVISAALSLCCITMNLNHFAYMAETIMIVDTVVMLTVIPYTEKQLKSRFGK